MYFTASPILPARAQAKALPGMSAANGFSSALESGRKLLSQRKLTEARAAFETALGMAKTDDERADAMIGIAEALSSQYETRKRLDDVDKLPGITPFKKAQARLAYANSYTGSSDQSTARAEYGKVLAIPELPDTLKAQALLGRSKSYMSSSFLNNANFQAGVSDLESILKLEKAQDTERAEALLNLAGVHFQLLRKEQALANIDAVLALAGATDEHKAKALMFTGNFRHMNKEGEKARAAWLRIPALAGASTELKIGAYRGVATSFLSEMKPNEAQAELEKALLIPELSGGDKASLLNDLGDLQQSSGNLVGARATFRRIADSMDSGAIQRKDATIKVGKTFGAEKNDAAARETWEKLAGDKSTHAVEALRLITLSHAEQMEYSAARAALDRWIAVPLDDYWKEDAWILMGRIYERESNWIAAREAFQKLTASPKARATRRVQAVLGVIRTHEGEKNPEAALQAYGALAAAVKSTSQPSPAEQSELAQYRAALAGQLKQLAAARGKEKATLPSAVTLYETAVEVEYRSPNRVDLQIELAELLMGHDMVAEAKVEFQKVVDAKDANVSQKQKAARKLEELAAKSGD